VTLSNLERGFIVKPDATQTALDALQTRVARDGTRGPIENPPLPPALR